MTKIHSLSMRKFIEKELYYKAKGFFTTTENLISSPKNPQALFNCSRSRYYAQIDKLYQSGQFTTPAELWRPHFAEAIANWVVEQQSDKPLHFVEVGAGSGALAADLMQFFDGKQAVKYTTIEISEQLAHLQQTRLSAYASASVRNVSAFDVQWSEFDRADETVVVLATELFDNLACEKLVVPARFEANLSNVKQAFMEMDESGGSLREAYRPLTDPLIKECLKAWRRVHGRRSESHVLYLPTAQYQFLTILRDRLPADSMSVIIDFDEFPRESYGVNAPLIQNADSVYNDLTKIPERGACDIMFATDFEFCRHVLRRESEIVKQSEFLQRYCTEIDALTHFWTRFNALRDEYHNVSVLLSPPAAQNKPTKANQQQ